MSKRPGNFGHNYPKVIRFLKDHGIEYEEFNNGQHLKILGDTSYVELWPSRMTYHLIQSERSLDGYNRLSFYFDEQEFDDLLNG